MACKGKVKISQVEYIGQVTVPNDIILFAIGVISPENKMLNKLPSEDDFTTKHYRKLIRLAQLNYQFVSYENPPFGERFILWRHDCDFH